MLWLFIDINNSSYFFRFFFLQIRVVYHGSVLVILTRAHACFHDAHGFRFHQATSTNRSKWSTERKTKNEHKNNMHVLFCSYSMTTSLSLFSLNSIVLYLTIKHAAPFPWKSFQMYFLWQFISQDTTTGIFHVCSIKEDPNCVLHWWGTHVKWLWLAIRHVWLRLGFIY